MLKRLKKGCLVCNDLADGIHFDALSCSACAAFFRRTVADGLEYTCSSSRTCCVSHDLQQGKLEVDKIYQSCFRFRRSCKSCRFRKCLEVGMLPNKVRKKWQNTQMVLSRNVQPVENEIDLNDIVALYLAHTERRLQKYQRIYGKELQSAASFTVATLRNFQAVNECEPSLVLQYLKAVASHSNFSDNDRTVLFNNFRLAAYVAESAMQQVRVDNQVVDRIMLLDGSYFFTDEESLKNLYAQNPSPLNDPEFLARNSQPGAKFYQLELMPAMRAFMPNKQEFAALLSLLLWDPDIPNLSLSAKSAMAKNRRMVVKELADYYNAENIDISLRLGNLILLLLPLKEQFRLSREFEIMCDIHIKSKSI